MLAKIFDSSNIFKEISIFKGLQRFFKIPKNLCLRLRSFFFVSGPFLIFVATLKQIRWLIGMMAHSYDSERLRGGGMVAEIERDDSERKRTFALVESLSSWLKIWLGYLVTSYDNDHFYYLDSHWKVYLLIAQFYLNLLLLLQIIVSIILLVNLKGQE